MTVTPARLPASSAILRAQVTTVMSAFSGKCLAISIVVEPGVENDRLAGRIVAAAARRCGACCVGMPADRTSKDESEAAFGVEIAPP